MAGCDRCGIENDFLYQCDRCGRRYCTDHLAKETHDCTSIAPGDDAGTVDDAPHIETIPLVVDEAETANEDDFWTTDSEDPSDASGTETSTAESASASASDTATAPAATSASGATTASGGTGASGGPRATSSGGTARTARRTTATGTPAGSALDRLPESRATLAIVLAVVAVLAVGGGWYVAGPDGALAGSPLDGAGGGTAAVNSTAVERLVHERINEERRDGDVEPLAYDPRLAEIAASHSEDMGENDYVAHASPEGETVADRFERFEYACDRPGEILLFTFYDRDVGTGDGTAHFDTEEELARGIVDLWMRSDAHARSILHDSWERQGIGVHVTDESKVFVTRNTC